MLILPPFEVETGISPDKLLRCCDFGRRGTELVSLYDLVRDDVLFLRQTRGGGPYRGFYHKIT